MLSGTLADGTPFAFSSNEGDTIAAGSITLQAADVANGPAIINVPAVAAPSGVHYGQTLNLSDGGTLNDDFNAGWGGRSTWEEAKLVVISRRLVRR